MTEAEDSRTCACGCGAPVGRRRRFLRSHDRRPKPPAERLLEKLVRNEQTGCLEFTGCLRTKYGRIGAGGRGGGGLQAHRVAWESTHGPIPDGLCVLHRCDNPACCEPTHLFLGTVADNNLDKARKGRGRRGPLPYGVRRRRGRWIAQVYHPRGTTVYLGTFDSIEEAASVAAEFKRVALTGGINNDG